MAVCDRFDALALDGAERILLRPAVLGPIFPRLSSRGGLGLHELIEERALVTAIADVRAGSRANTTTIATLTQVAATMIRALVRIRFTAL